MQTSDRVGILCDFCKCVLKNDFKYHSLDFYKVKMFNGRKPTTDEIRRGGSVKSCDMCAGCYEAVSDKVVECYSLNMNNKTGIYKLFCEYSGQNLLSSKLLYYVVFSHVDVKIDNQPLSCVKCGKLSGSVSVVCTCGSNKFSKQALVQVEDKVLEINISDIVYNEWLVKIDDVKPVSDWSSSS